MATTTKTTIKIAFGKDASGKPEMTITQSAGRQVQVKRARVFRTHLEVMREFQVEMELRQVGGYMFPGGSVSIWFPNMLTNKSHEWKNRLVKNDTVIEECAPTNRSAGRSPWNDPVRITFAKLGRNGYTFVGVFKKDSKASRPGFTVFTRQDNVTDIVIATSVTTV